jgi:hypothetical protein
LNDATAAWQPNSNRREYDRRKSFTLRLFDKRAAGMEPATLAWKAQTSPFNH